MTFRLADDGQVEVPWWAYRPGGKSPYVRHYSKLYEEAGTVIPGWENTPADKLPPRYRKAVSWPPPDHFGGHRLKEYEKALLNVLSVRSRAVMLLYVFGHEPAKRLGQIFGVGFLGQHEVYMRAGIIRRALARTWDHEGVADWDLAASLAAEGVSEDEIAEILKVKPNYVRSKLKQRKLGNRG